MILAYWLQWIAAFLIVIAVLSLAVWLSEWWKSRKEIR